MVAHYDRTGGSNTSGQAALPHRNIHKITSMFRVAHGHAAILCDRVLFSWMIENVDKCCDLRGKEYLELTLNEIGKALGCKNASIGAEKLKSIFSSLELEVPSATEAQFAELKTSVNPVRLKNHPILLNEEMIDKLYHDILRKAK